MRPIQDILDMRNPMEIETNISKSNNKDSLFITCKLIKWRKI